MMDTIAPADDAWAAGYFESDCITISLRREDHVPTAFFSATTIAVTDGTPPL
jgi:hypothetical protein